MVKANEGFSRTKNSQILRAISGKRKPASKSRRMDSMLQSMKRNGAMFLLKRNSAFLLKIVERTISPA
jgi:hypothetical protein